MRSSRHLRSILFLVLTCLYCSCSNPSADIPEKAQVAVLPDMEFSQSVDLIEVYDFLEVQITVTSPTAKNPFTDVFVSGKIEKNDHTGEFAVEGFCDSHDGSRFLVRFMPLVPGDYRYTVTYWQDNLQRVYSGTFKAVNGGRRGMISVDSEYPWHFIWKGTGEHYFLNGTTAFLLMGWDDEKIIRESLSRFHALSINRVRVLLDGRTDHFWTEPIKPGGGFHAHLNPWVAQRPDDIAQPGFDYAQFNVDYWKKFERMLKFAREKNIIVSIILGWNDTPIHPSAGSEDERRYLRNAVARFAAYSNITWDLGDDLDDFRNDAWTHDTGTFLYGRDPYHHLATSHPVNNRHQDRSSSWFGMTSFQQWRRPLHAWMLEQRKEQIATGRIIPQVNEEYGYEDHYPPSAPYKAPVASSEANRRAAWEMVMAGGYQTTGETAKRGTGLSPDTGGGWVNGRGDDTMKMLDGYAHMVTFFTGIEWWKTDPHDELVNHDAFCLAEPGRQYVVYLSHGGDVTVRLDPGQYEVKWFNPRSGEYSGSQVALGPVWTSASAEDGADWVILMKRYPMQLKPNPKKTKELLGAVSKGSLISP
jgi:hypothetical protein